MSYIKKYTEKSFETLTGHQRFDQSITRMFEVLIDKEENEYILNIFKYFDPDTDISDNVDQLYTEYDVGYEEWWDNISYKFYGTPYLWWIIALTNEVVNPFEYLEEGTTIKIINPNKIYEILSQINNIRER